MSVNELTWDPRNVPQRYVVSFFVDIYRDDPNKIISSTKNKNESLNYYNITTADNSTEAQICAAMCLAYMENQGLEYHLGKDRSKCYAALLSHFMNAKGEIIKTPEIIDEYFMFAWEKK